VRIRQDESRGKREAEMVENIILAYIITAFVTLATSLVSVSLWSARK
jgi:hypothetical protein